MKKIISNLIFIFLFLSVIASKSPSEVEKKDFLNLNKTTHEIEIYLFHSEECRVCRSMISGLVSRLEVTYPFLKIHLLNLKEPKNYQILRRFERILGRKGEELPFAVIGNHLLSGEKEFEEKLDSIILEASLSGPSYKTIHEKVFESTPESFSSKKISAELIYFSQSGCAKCGRTDVLLSYLMKKYPGLTVKKIDLSDPEGKLIAEAIAERLNLPEKIRLIAPAILVGEIFLSSREISEEKIEQVLTNLLSKNKTSITVDPEEMKKAKKNLIERFKSMGPIPVALGGLIDGINPCAFATLIFLISYLTMMGSKRNEILKVGLGFTGSVFITYFLIGIGLTSFIQKFSFIPSLSRGIYLFASTFAIIMGVFSFRDYLLWKKGKEKEMKLQLPKSLKKLIHKSIKGIDFSSYQFLGAILLGFIISFFEFTCTGQVYLPTIIFVMGIAELQRNALFYLLLYNFAFITPLFLVFLLFYLGVSQRRLSLFLQRRGSAVKLFTSVFFLFLGTSMFFTAF